MMEIEPEIDDEDEDRDWAPPPIGMNGIRFMANKCSTCIFRPGNLMSLDRGRVGEMLADVREHDSFVPCHKTLGKGRPTAICKGSDDAHEGALARLARRFEFVEVLTEEQVLAETSR